MNTELRADYMEEEVKVALSQMHPIKLVCVLYFLDVLAYCGTFCDSNGVGNSERGSYP